VRDKEWESCERDEIVNLQFPFLELLSVKERARERERERLRKRRNWLFAISILGNFECSK
jgi:hypothetical protein